MDVGEAGNKDGYIASIIREIRNWRSEGPGVVAVALGYVAVPVTWLVQTLVPTAAIEGLLDGLDWLAKSAVSGASAKNPDDLQQCDAAANSTINWAIAAAAAEGGAAGFFGLFTLPLDIPAVIGLALRTVRQIGAEYGYSEDTEGERQFAFSVLRASGANSQAEKAEALLAMHLLLVALQQQAWKAMAEKAAVQAISVEGALTAVRALARQLGINLTKRKALAAIPGIGAVVGASVNGWYIRDVGVAAQRLYQERWLRDRGLLIDVDVGGGEPDTAAV